MILLISGRADVIASIGETKPNRPAVTIVAPGKALEAEEARRFSLAFVDFTSVPNGLDRVRLLHAAHPAITFVAIVEDERIGVEAVRNDAADYLVWPPAFPDDIWKLASGLLKSAPKARKTPERIGDYRILRRLGAGGMAEVFLAERPGGGAPIVLKCMLPEISEDPEHKKMFATEVRVLSTLKHPNIVRIFDVGRVDGHLFMAIEHVPGFDLDRIGRAVEWRFPVPLACFIAAEVASAMAHAHGRTDAKGPLSIVHRDINPPNILISERGAVKLIDFGIANYAWSLVRTATGVVKGKLDYMSPEQIDNGAVDHRSDVYSLGVVLHLLLSSVHPFQASTPLQTMLRIRQGRFDPPSATRAIPPEVDAIVVRAMALERDRRYQSASNMEQDLRACVERCGGANEASLAAFAPLKGPVAPATDGTQRPPTKRLPRGVIPRDDLPGTLKEERTFVPRKPS